MSEEKSGGEDDGGKEAGASAEVKSKNKDESATETNVNPGPDEVYCTSCGAIIKERAEICPECGVRQEPAIDDATDTEPSQENPPVQDSGTSISDGRQHELEKLANKNTTTVMLVGFLLTPGAYLMVGRPGLAALNFITFNYFLLGPIVVPFHCKSIIDNAEKELRRAGVEGY